MGSTSEVWKNDRKYHYASQGFSQSIDNPVPIAYVACHEHIFKKLVKAEKYIVYYVSFIDGITRTIWLLVHGAKYFPIECSIRDGANILAELAGYDGNEYRTVEQLTTNT